MQGNKGGTETAAKQILKCELPGGIIAHSLSIVSPHSMCIHSQTFLVNPSLMCEISLKQCTQMYICNDIQVCGVLSCEALWLCHKLAFVRCEYAPGEEVAVPIPSENQSCYNWIMYCCFLSLVSSKFV